MELNLDRKKVLITGASRGIGAAIKNALKDEGAEVYNFSKSTDIDLMTEEGLEDTLEHMDIFDIIINNVGGGGTWGSFEWRNVLEKNFGLTYQLTQRFLKKKRTWGRVITISSIYGKEKGPNPEFTAAKAAQIAYMKSISDKYPGITFNTICPGHINVNKPFHDNPKIIGQPEDVANIVTFLCSDKAKHINGTTIVVDGGESHAF